MRESLLTRHFLQRFLENDLISPDADRHDALAVVAALLIALPLFVTALLSIKFLFQPFQSPAWTTVGALGDNFLYVTCSMIVMALIAVAQWDALSLDARDASILGILPVPHRTIVRAKLKALGLFAATFAIALNLAPTLIHPSLLAAKLPMPSSWMLLLILAHGVSTMAAGLFGFVTVLGIREFMHATLPTSIVRRVAVFVQALLVVLLVATLLLLPQLAYSAGRMMTPAAGAAVYTVPPLWFVGAYDRIGGRLIAALPQSELPAWSARLEETAARIYQTRQPVLPRLAVTAATVLPITFALALTLYVRNTRRLPMPGTRRPHGRRRWTAILTSVVERFIARTPAVQAGFFFTLQTLARSVAHRVSMATSVAIGLAAAAVGIGGAVMAGAGREGTMPLSFLASQTVVVLVAMGAFRNSGRVPAELRANWVFRMAWSGDERPYVAGVKRAGLLAVAAPMLLALFPLHALVVGVRVASAHLAFGLVLAVVVTELSFLGMRKLPFASSFVPSGTLASSGAVYALIFGFVVFGLAWIERLFLRVPHGTFLLLASSGVLVAAVRAADLWQHQTPVPVQLDEAAEPPTQRLNLSD